MYSRNVGLSRVVITGLGVVCPLGVEVQDVWKHVIDGETGVGPITRFDASDYQCKIAAEIPVGTGPNQLNPADWLPKNRLNRIDDFILYSLVASKKALHDSGVDLSDEDVKKKTGVVIGSGSGGVKLLSKNAFYASLGEIRRISPFLITGSSINMAAGEVAINYGLLGPNFSTSTACSSGSHAIAMAAQTIALGQADRMVAGGAEAGICEFGIASFLACRALARKFNDRPKEASRPFDLDHDGFVMGEGCAIVILESLDKALERGANIYAEILSCGMSCDASHITKPRSDYLGATTAMRKAIEGAGLTSEDVDYVNAHGTSTPYGDEAELGALKNLFDDNKVNTVSVSSTKSSTGHLLGASGAIEAVFSVLSIRDNIIPPTLNLHRPVVETKFDLVALEAKKRKTNIVLSNSFGFGGTNVTLAFGRYTT